MIKKITNREMINGISGMQQLMKKELPIRASYALMKNKNKVNSVLKNFDEISKKLTDKYVKRDENGNPLKDKKGLPKSDNQEQWNKDFEELLDIENEIDVHQISISDLQGVNLSVGQLEAINFMIKEE
ncbi:hypothetical protein BJV85_002822 [Clostridium acetobutylicum]|uniref:Uncharacterized protein n=1 Tax=Clostridium acetobutylicum (strain ATCC 824 / DSM 792 / JCM 1419 / IAM 19013 / LMG 5710 / NBRC 13948 / NRRL B-527 / VKM B-1787 / 2291 / W) TaxID=272562 RepID=Q97JU8_CLOAB|nr:MULTISPECIES: hypothetical protein [Clostridium]AAK79147.1 Hypothetical protein, CF-35 family [Clostridium acetobutylicum ATCC 824]ADZ20225.1 conserved hypothetical protein [Clostridium acetobutylicum EA 2018]AEI31682.1 hypothetical protein SMB_G1195 [Clostridium acetobutylicum DSM 1731]AWV81601.1 hypothetical protein DK921_16180 [Clostridium acetobutylicum]MBC2393242.1 hypothetical protein [Clostridium acetobutylicum]